MMPLDTTKAEFNWPNARACCELSALAYSPLAIDPGDPVPRIIFDLQTDTQVIVVDKGNCIAVANRGSSCLEDFIQDAKVFRSHPRATLPWDNFFDPECEFHSGILENTASVIGELVETVCALGGETKPVFVMGHSKGGGEALLEALELKRRKINVFGVYTFGGLRIFNKPAAAKANSELRDVTFRVVNQNDIVPRIPLAVTGYRHCGHEIFLPVPNGWAFDPALWTKIISDAFGLYGAYRHRKDVLVANHILGGAAGYKQRIQFLK